LCRYDDSVIGRGRSISDILLAVKGEGSGWLNQAALRLVSALSGRLVRGPSTDFDALSARRRIMIAALGTSRHLFCSAETDGAAEMPKTIAVVGAGPKAAAIATKAWALRSAGIKDVDVIVFDPEGPGAAWDGRHGYTDGQQLLCTPPERDLGFP
jgi:hypothetical protein